MMLICFIAFLLYIVAKKMETKDLVVAPVMLVTLMIGYIMGVAINVGGRSESYFQ